MPKERRDRSVSHDRYRGSPLRCDSSRTLHASPKPTEENIKEWEDARCSVCMEHPHNAVLLICSSYENGCRPYMCDTSYRHSNCLDQFRKSFKETPTSSTTQQEEADGATAVPDVAPELTDVNPREGGSEADTGSSGDLEKAKPELTCPLCRGQIKEWVIEEAARCFMNSKKRSCSCETCDFSGTYSDLRKHARIQHPTARPSEADPERQRSWRRLERQRDLGDLLSTLQSSFGGEEREDDHGILSFDDGGWLTVFFLIRVFRPGSSSSPRRSSSWSGTSRARSQIGTRRRSTRLWGESYEGESGPSSRNDGDNLSSDDESGSRRRRVRRRTFVEEDEP
ncbi:PREDICTED: uncharacterized protein LOC104815259 [Tarenaya hassleriana]|uniref:uncharacterized protein LOC104815259 n=1 Tax=Tarenaya hassleriana TaxID=28532 RepID=UPI00053C2E62|nr:PREDICTED: uncharacterized protein LOC104815259 [Tarenaya hassleriana]XP_010541894.1 PREDICTED: uncharacterized protein LOC104815259 [Tarenaya hassleriana]